ncbi:hypothetical protein MVEN_00840400 [Mycena venus]|uniref:Uncharacterized protein n=1 Tax=Mycena venus TaxID=2733690 RepID=A0A8H6YDX6_9AGAR|nr:hypothetical protein MVEN_00840400 [Mycena venus]
MAPPNLKQVGQLFHQTIAAMRDDTPDMATLKPQAIEWLKATRLKLMRDIEQAYYSLENSRNTPLSQPAWALDPAQPLYLTTNSFPPVLEPFRQAILNNLGALLRDCGFEHISSSALGSWINLSIYFPAQLTGAPAARNAPQTLFVEDEFSRPASGRKKIGGGTFAAGNFGRLLIDARGESGNTSGTVKEEEENTSGSNPGGSKKRRRASRTTKEEGEEENDVRVKEEGDETEGRRLRSATRASSAVTLRSDTGRDAGARRSARKRVKKEEDNNV